MTVSEQYAAALAQRHEWRGITQTHLDHLHALHTDRHDRHARKENETTMTTRRAIALAATALAAGLALTACSDDATVVDHNNRKAADNFEIERRVVFFNGITDSYLLEIEGLCSITDEGHQLEVLCKVGDDEYKKHFLGLSDNVSYFIEQMEPSQDDAYRYRVTFKPEVILPDIDLRTSGGDDQ